jgi:polysaccharide deacetylase 2 family uncharacterized protein YibQ
VNKPQRNRIRKQQGGAVYAALAIIAVIVLAAGAYLVFKRGATAPPHQVPDVPKAAVKVPPKRNIPVTSPQQPRSSAKKRPVVAPDNSAKQQAALTPTTGTKAELAIIIDDMGSSMHEARALFDIGVPLTFSIIPGLRSYREVATFATSNGIETMIHIPMQSKGWPERRLESNGLLMSMNDTEISERLNDFIRTIPGAVGANNHMGSEYTEHAEKMRLVLTVLKGRGLFFIDSVTSSGSVAPRLAKEIGIKFGRRNVFLDNEQNDAYIRGQIRQAVNLAKRTGRAIAICHPHPTTLQTLAAVLPELQKQGITIVPASRLVR